MWKKKEIPESNIDEYHKLLSAGFHEYIASIYALRNYTFDEVCDLYYNIEYAIYSLPNLKGADECAEKIAYHISANSNIAIYADYDTDGLTSGYVMAQILREIAFKMNSTAQIYLHYPERSDGYGLSFDFCSKAIDANCKLMITVDNGIAAKEQVKYLVENNVDVVITDHHEPVAGKVPEQCCICNPCYNDTNISHLAGVAVAWNVAYATYKLCLNDKPSLETYIPLVCLGTIADMMEFSKENALYIKYGMQLMNNEDSNINPFLKALKNCVTPIWVGYTDISWEIAPLFNAAGRVGHTKEAGACLFVSSNDDIEKGISLLEQYNTERKELSTKAAKEAVKKAIQFEDDGIVIFDASEYQKGLYGIIANNLIKHFNTPAFVFEVSRTKNVVIGSMRSPDVDLVNVLSKIDKNLCLNYGGHAQACSATFNLNSLEEAIKEFNKFYFEELKSIDINEDIHYDLEIALTDAYSFSLMLTIKDMPFTPDEEPVFKSKAIISALEPTKSNPNNYWLGLSDPKTHNTVCKIWQRNMIDYINKYDLSLEDAVEIVFKLKQDFRFKTKDVVMFDIIDIRPIE